MTLYRSLACAALAGLSAIAVTTAAATAQQTAAAFAIGGTARAISPATEAGRLAPLPATAEQLSFSGESGARQFALYVLPVETTRTSRLVLWLQSAVSIMPESSSLRVFVNDLPVGTATLGTGEQALSIDLAPGTLQPGFNQIRIAVDQHHRVDCSRAGTYELWTTIDPKRSGLFFDGGMTAVTALEDMPALARRSTDGVTTIHAFLPAGASPADVDRTMSAVQSAVLLGEFSNPQVTFAKPADPAAIEVVVGTQSTLAGGNPSRLAGNTPIPSVTFEPGAIGRAPRLIVSGTTVEDLEQSLQQLSAAAVKHRPAGTASGQRALAEAKGRALAGGQSISLAALGMQTRQFTGRFYTEQVAFQLPADFYPADYADGELALNAGYTARLSDGAQLVVRANGRVVSTIKLHSSRRGLIDNQKLRLPLSALQPGKNILSFEANLPSDSDAACDPAVQANPPVRLFISDTSTLKIPPFARVGHLPELAAMTGGGGGANGGSQRDLSVVVGALDPAHLDVAGSFLAKLAWSVGRPADLHFQTTMPHEETGDLIGFGTYTQLPQELLAAARLASPETGFGSGQTSGLLVRDAAAADLSEDWKKAFETDTGDQGIAEAAARGATAAVSGFQSFVSSFAEPVDLATRLKTLGADLGDRALAFAGLSQWAGDDDFDPAMAYRPASDASLVIAQGPAPEAEGAAWTIVAASDAPALAKSVAMLTTTSRWNAIGGGFTSMRGDAGAMESRPAAEERLFETQPRSLGNLRLVVAGWFSRHTQSYVTGLLAICLLLGATTYLFVRSIGERRP
ncbi:cellulose biosynthesis cyclic di-GMP-binding regulatory protein BcsB [Aureimonas glaciei]|uniref:Cyclic di-GMP-binding protein n=1 Tax=Aureimonas glaciei TaxID=1776957 RepID=A0A916Y8D8_9HYPH|nr:cellulose biosynthesis cyclic di-GMP-binding regulatory protein BcsB [Aureimonas glaciei]GGD34554.1 cellulose synthase BcsB subunit [Aureimonas glaciei]